MLLIDHTIGPSPIHGLGVFAAEPAAKGQVLWRFEPTVDIVILEEQLAGLPPHVQRNCRFRAEHQEDRGFYVWSLDGDAFMNHSDDPALVAEGTQAVATRDIAVGDELTWDYGRFGFDAFTPPERPGA